MNAVGLDVLTHEDREQVVGLGGVVEGDLAEDTVLLVHGRDAQFLGVHLAETLEALHRVVLDALAGVAAHLDEGVALAVGVRVEVVLAPLDLEWWTGERSLRPASTSGRMKRNRKGCSRGVDVLAVDVGVRHQDDLVIAQLRTLRSPRGPRCRRRRSAPGSPGSAGSCRSAPSTLRILPRIGGSPGTRGFGRTWPSRRRNTLTDEDLALGWVVRLAVGELARRDAVSSSSPLRRVRSLASRAAMPRWPPGCPCGWIPRPRWGCGPASRPGARRRRAGRRS
ncbi:hypothetical protein SPURM210S_06057 [Streptomyces purpurascens]